MAKTLRIEGSSTRATCRRVSVRRRCISTQTFIFALLWSAVVNAAKRKNSTWQELTSSACWGDSTIYSFERCCVQQDPECFVEFFTYEYCCSFEVVEPDYGCWDEIYNYAKCCVGHPRGNPQCFFGDYMAAARCCGDIDPNCAAKPYSTYRLRAWEYAITGRVDQTFLFETHWIYHISPSPGMLPLCPQAHLMAGIVKLQEPIGYANEQSMLWQVSQMMTSSLIWQMPASVFHPWPIDILFQRAREMAEPINAEPMRTIELVISYCQEDLSWVALRIRAEIYALLDVTIVLKCGTPKNSLTALRGARSLRYITVEDGPIRADECSAYLGFVEQRYNVLSDYTMFVHADAPEHVPDASATLPRSNDNALNTFECIIRAAAYGRLKNGFIHLSHNYNSMETDFVPMAKLWRYIFQTSLVPAKVNSYCCSHFIVTRNRLLLRPPSFYARARKFITSQEAFIYLPGVRIGTNDDFAGRLPCQIMMIFWHVMWGEDLVYPDRNEDMSAPFFLKLRNIKAQRPEKGGFVSPP